MSEVDANRSIAVSTGPVVEGVLLPPGPVPKREKTGGRLKGTPNRVTREVREVLCDLAEGNAGRVQELFDRVAAEDPAEAIRLYLSLCRYVIPTLSAAAIADITPKSPREALSRLSDDDLMAIIVESAEAADLVRQGVKTQDELIERLAASGRALPAPDLTDEELLR